MQLTENLSLFRYDWATAMLGSLVAQSPSSLVLDIGAGDGRMKGPIETAGGVCRGFDLYPASPQIERWDLDEPPSASIPPAGGALLLDVIEHCNNPGLALRHVSSALSTGAFLLLTMPNPKWSRSRLYALGLGDPICFTQSDLDLNHHVFTPWPHILEHLLNDAGFRVERYVTLDGKTPWPARPYGVRYPLRLLAAVAMKAIEQRDPSACGMSFGVIARKAN